MATPPKAGWMCVCPCSWRPLFRSRVIAILVSTAPLLGPPAPISGSTAGWMIFSFPHLDLKCWAPTLTQARPISTTARQCSSMPRDWVPRTTELSSIPAAQSASKARSRSMNLSCSWARPTKSREEVLTTPKPLSLWIIIHRSSRPWPDPLLSATRWDWHAVPAARCSIFQAR